LRLAALLGTDPGIGARRVDERDDRRPELVGEAHETERFSISLGMGHAEVARDVLAGVAALLVTQRDHGPPLEAREPAHEGLVVAEDAAAVELAPVPEREVHEVERGGPLRMPRDLRALPRGQAAIGLSLEAGETAFEPRDLRTCGRLIRCRSQHREPVL